MRVRLFELRLLGVLLFALWSGAFALVAVEYHPGGPYDLAVAAAALLPCIVAALAVLWPPLARGDRAAVAIGWLGVIAALLLIPSLGGLAGPLLGTAGQPILPAPEVAYGAFLALLATCLFCGLGLARELLGETALRRRRLFVGTVLALAMASVVGTSFGAAAVANAMALQRRSLPPSAWGPTDPAAVPPACTGSLAVGPQALITESASAEAGTGTVGSVSLSGARSGDDERWTADLDLHGTTVRRAYVRVDSSSWSRSDDGPWQTGTDLAPSLDGALLTAALAPAQRVAAEDAGIELVGGARARHCRTTLTGAAALASFPPLVWLTGGPLPESPVLGPWRGQLDWWVFGDGQLGLATVRLTGPSPRSWGGASILGTLQARLQATERTRPETVLPPG